MVARTSRELGALRSDRPPWALTAALGPSRGAGLPLAARQEDVIQFLELCEGWEEVLFTGQAPRNTTPPGSTAAALRERSSRCHEYKGGLLTSGSLTVSLLGEEAAIDVKDSRPLPQPLANRASGEARKVPCRTKLVFSRGCSGFGCLVPGRGPRRPQFPSSCIVSDPSCWSAHDSGYRSISTTVYGQ